MISNNNESKVKRLIQGLSYISLRRRYGCYHRSNLHRRRRHHSDVFPLIFQLGDVCRILMIAAAVLAVIVFFIL